jgi:5S rRNA maturation endonuclease (ribonuclease M5)
MYSINKYPLLSYESIKTRISDYEIYSFYLGRNLQLGKAYHSLLRLDDSNPSFGLFESGDGKILFKDQGIGLSGNVIQFVQYYCNLSSFEEALLKIYKDLILNVNNNINIKKDIQVIEYKKKDKSKIEVQRQDINKNDIKYWGSFNVSKKILDLFEVAPIKYLFINDTIKHVYTNDNPMYVYKVYNALKIYRPLSDKQQKWYGSVTRKHIFGYKQLPKEGDLLIITKSLKDVMCLYSLGYVAISPSSEGTLIPKEIIEDLKKRFKKIIILYDNDLPGKKYTERIVNKYNLLFTFIPDEYEEKDISDFTKHYGKVKAKDIIKQLIKI